VPESLVLGLHTPTQDSLIIWLLITYDARYLPPEADEPNASPTAPARNLVLPGLAPRYKVVSQFSGF